MECYIKDKKTFETKHHAPAVDWDITLESIYDEVSKFEIKGSKDKAQQGDFLFAGDFAGVIKSIEPHDEYLSITCDDIVTIFQRDLFAVADTPASGGLEAYIKRRIDAAYVNVSDAMYKMPYIKVITGTTTSGNTLPDIDDDVWNIKSYLAKVRRVNGIYTSFEIQRNNLIIRIFHKDRANHNIFLTMSAFELLEETYSNTEVGKVTTRAEDTGATRDWYLLVDGTITNTYTPNNRINGLWELTSVKDDSEAEEKAKNIFAKNSKSHLIEFATDRQYNFYDNVTIRTKEGRVLQSYISAIRLEKGKTKTIYKTGELRLLLHEKLNQKLGGK